MQHLETGNDIDPETDDFNSWAEGYPPPASMLKFLEIAERYARDHHDRCPDGSVRIVS